MRLIAGPARRSRSTWSACSKWGPAASSAPPFCTSIPRKPKRLQTWCSERTKMKQKDMTNHHGIRRLAAVAALACGLSAGAVHAADDAFVCMEESQEKCDYENENMD